MDSGQQFNDDPNPTPEELAAKAKADAAAEASAAERMFNEQAEHDGDGDGGRQGVDALFADLITRAGALSQDDADIEKTNEIIRESISLPATHRDRVFKAIKAATKMAIGSMREMLKGGSEREEGGDHIDLAAETINRIGPENILHTHGFFWTWRDTGVWRKTEDISIERTVQETVKSIIEYVTTPTVSSVATALKRRITIQKHPFNLGGTDTVNCLNGELEMTESGDGWVLRPHNRANYRTTQIPVAYDGNAKAPKFAEFLQQIFCDDPDKDAKIEILLALIGYSLMSHARHEKFVILIGVGGNGKSVLLAVLKALLGSENIAGVQPSEFGNKFQRGHLDQKLANIVTELPEGTVIDDGATKAITSGETTTAEHKFVEPFDMTPFCTLWIGANHMPHTRDFSEGLMRRAVILTFNRVFTEKTKDVKLLSKLVTELPGILNLALAAYARADMNGFVDPPSSRKAKAEWRIEIDMAAQFIDDECTAEPGHFETHAALFTAFQSWVNVNGVHRTLSSKGLGKRLRGLGYEPKTANNTKGYVGLRIGKSYAQDNTQDDTADFH